MELDSYGLILPTNFVQLAKSLELLFAHYFSRLVGTGQSDNLVQHHLHLSQESQLNQGNKQPDVPNRHFQVKVLILLLQLQLDLYQRLLTLF